MITTERSQGDGPAINDDIIVLDGLTYLPAALDGSGTEWTIRAAFKSLFAAFTHGIVKAIETGLLSTGPVDSPRGLTLSPPGDTAVA